MCATSTCKTSVCKHPSNNVQGFFSRWCDCSAAHELLLIGWTAVKVDFGWTITGSNIADVTNSTQARKWGAGTAAWGCRDCHGTCPEGAMHSCKKNVSVKEEASLQCTAVLFCPATNRWSMKRLEFEQNKAVEIKANYCGKSCSVDKDRKGILAPRVYHWVAAGAEGQCFRVELKKHFFCPPEQFSLFWNNQYAIFADPQSWSRCSRCHFWQCERSFDHPLNLLGQF